MKTLTVHRVGVASFAKLFGVWAAILGLLVGVVGAITSTVGVIANNNYSVLGDIGVSIAIIVGWVVVYPLVMFLIGWIQGAIVAIIFNIVVSGSGGLALTIDEEDMKVSNSVEKAPKTVSKK